MHNLYITTARKRAHIRARDALRAFEKRRARRRRAKMHKAVRVKPAP